MNSKKIFKLVEFSNLMLIMAQGDVRMLKENKKNAGSFSNREDGIEIELAQEKVRVRKEIKVGIEKFAKKLRYEENEGLIRIEQDVALSVKDWLDGKISNAETLFEIRKKEDAEFFRYEDCGDFYRENLKMAEMRLNCFKSYKDVFSL